MQAPISKNNPPEVPLFFLIKSYLHAVQVLIFLFSIESRKNTTKFWGYPN